MMKVVWGGFGGNSKIFRISILCECCADLIRRRCQIDGRNFLARSCDTPRVCEVCDLT